MQVKELDSFRTSIWVFFLMAVSVTLSSYLLRLLVRSKYIRNTKVGLIKGVRDYALIPGAQPVPTISFLKALWHYHHNLIAIALWMVITPAPLIALWSGHIIPGMKVAVAIPPLIISFGSLVFLKVGPRSSPRSFTFLHVAESVRIRPGSIEA